VGELILEALDHGCTRIILFVGGTSGTDAGVGMLRALGARALDARGGDCAPGGAGLVDLDTVDTTHRDPRLAGVEFIVASDVTNPLLGASGAAHIFAPQKGADRAAVEILEAGLTRAAEVISPAHATRPGSGAGGGLAYGALAVLGAHVESGAEAVMAMTGFEESLEGADCVVTGEGSFDDQSLEGKITGTVIARCQERGIPVVVVCGVSRTTQPVLGLRIVEISAGAASLEDSITRAEGLLRDAGVRILELIT
jgi:glycerate kinase